MHIDETDYRIIRLLQKNARLPFKEIGEEVHMTGQAVGSRVKRLEELGVIEAYSLILNLEKLGQPITAVITMFMKTTRHVDFQQYVRDHPSVHECFRTSGEGCYVMKASFPSNEALNDMLDQLLRFGNFKVSLSIMRVK